jgi:histidine triad (HIT) family protein
MEDCLFCKIANRKIESDIVYEDDKAIVIRDIHPQAPVHDLVISKRHIPTLLDLKEEDKDLLWHLFSILGLVARKEGVAEKDSGQLLTAAGQAARSFFTFIFISLAAAQYAELVSVRV